MSTWVITQHILYDQYKKKREIDFSSTVRYIWFIPKVLLYFDIISRTRSSWQYGACRKPSGSLSQFLTPSSNTHHHRHRKKRPSEMSCLAPVEENKHDSVIPHLSPSDHCVTSSTWSSGRGREREKKRHYSSIKKLLGNGRFDSTNP